MTFEQFWNNTEKLAIHCQTQEEADKFSLRSNNLGKTWCDDNESYLKNNRWDVYKENTCYTNRGTFADYTFFKSNGVRIIEFSSRKEKNENR